MALLVGAIAFLTLVPAAVQMLAVGQLPIAQSAVYRQQALEAARAGLSDYINHVQSSSNYLDLCSSGASWTCPSDSTPATLPNTDNQGFANSPDASNWAQVQSSTSGDQYFQYLVNDSQYLSDSSDPVMFYVTGRAGPVTHPTYETLQAALSISSSSKFALSVSSTPTACGATEAIEVPAQATWAQIAVYGAQGGSSWGGSAGGGGDGADVVSDIPVTPSVTWTLSAGFAGESGNFQWASAFGYGEGGPGGCGSMDMSGGNGGGSSAVLNALDNTGGGGGGASAVCVGTVSQCTTDVQPLSMCTSSQTAPCLLAVAGGGAGDGGAGGGAENGVLKGVAGSGGSGGNSSGNPEGGWAGANGGGLSLLGLTLTQGGAGGTAGGYGGNQSSSTEGVPGTGTSLLTVLDSYGGGGGGGYSYGGLDSGLGLYAQTGTASAPAGGGGGGAGGGLLCSLSCGVLGILGTGGGGGAGSSNVALEATGSGCPFYSGPSVASYPVLSGEGDSGAVVVSFYNGTACDGGLLPPSVAVAAVQPVPSTSSVI